MVWRRLQPGELDHEFLWLGVSLMGTLLAWFWLHFALPLPRCAWHDFTGLPCPTCGATRCMRYITRGAWQAALLVNPFVFFTLAVGTVFDAYAAAVLLLRLPRLRLDHLPPRSGSFFRYGFLAVLALNWAWLVYRRV
jgi:hypothetical protein